MPFYFYVDRLDPSAESSICKEAKDVYEYCMRIIGSQHIGCNDELIVDGFDNEQIWQQIELYNSSILSHHEHQISVLTKGKAGSIKLKQTVKPSPAIEKKKVTFDSHNNEDDSASEQSDDAIVRELADQDVTDMHEDEVESEEEKELEELLKKVSGKESDTVDDDLDDDFGNGSDSDEHGESDDNENVSDSDEDDNNIDLAMKNSSVESLKEKLKMLNGKKTAKQKKSAVDDRFFKLSEMEAFLDEQDKKAMKSKPDTNNDEGSDDDDDEDDDDEEVSLYNMTGKQ
jgi:U3 small nucleolar RNA-associated protein MPP10